MQDLDQLMHICKVQSSCRLIQDIDRLSGTAAAQLRRQLNPLCLAAGELRRRLSQPDIGQSDIIQCLDLPVD